MRQVEVNIFFVSRQWLSSRDITFFQHLLELVPFTELLAANFFDCTLGDPPRVGPKVCICCVLQHCGVDSFWCDSACLHRLSQSCN